MAEAIRDNKRSHLLDAISLAISGDGKAPFENVNWVAGDGCLRVTTGTFGVIKHADDSKLDDLAKPKHLRIRDLVLELISNYCRRRRFDCNVMARGKPGEHDAGLEKHIKSTIQAQYWDYAGDAQKASQLMSHEDFMNCIVSAPV